MVFLFSPLGPFDRIQENLFHHFVKIMLREKSALFSVSTIN